MLYRPSLSLALLLAACGTPAITTLGDTDSGTGTSSTGGTVSDTTPTTTPITAATETTEQPTEGSASATEGGTTTSTTTIDPGTTTLEPDTTTTTATDTSTGPIVDTTTTTDGDTSTGPIVDTDTSSSTGDVELCECPDIEVPLDDGIFVLSGDAELWKYFPMSNTFELLGDLNCPGLFNSTFSMAVDRLGFAWVQFTDGNLRKVPVTDVSMCEDAGYIPGQQGVQNFGMAFVSNSQSDACDRIYGNTYDGLGPFAEGPNLGDFITIDPVNQQLAKLGKTNFNGAEVTGTGDGRAFVFGGNNPSKLVELDKTDGSVVDLLPLGTLEINNGAFAFAFFAGDFYFFTDSNNDFTNSEVTHLDYDDSDNNGIQDLTLLTDDAPLQIVGAGVSTCAPTAPQ
jgi:hypothetical protein